MITNKIIFKNILLFTLFLICSAFMLGKNENENISFIQKTLNSHFNKETNEQILKNFEINLTKNGFFRYKKIHLDGKIEYFSFNLSKFKSLGFAGTEDIGNLYLKTIGDDIIVQTYHDKEGDLDSMANYIIIPIKRLQMDSLIRLDKSLQKICTKLNSQ